MEMIRVWETIDKHLDLPAMWRRAVRFHEHERRMGFKNWRRSAKYGARELESTGAEVEVLETPADGKTAFLDHVMPMGWDCDFAMVEILDNDQNAEVLVDSLTQPLCIAPFSPPTPKDGVIGEIVHEHTYGRTPWKGKFILSMRSPESPSSTLRRLVNESGALGVLCAWSAVPFDEPDAHLFLNSFTTSPGWYPPAEETPAILFSLSPREGKRLADKMAEQRTRVKVTVRGRLGEDKFLTVSGALPGTEPKIAEVLAVAHMYEPLPADDATGSAGAVEVLAAIKRAIRSGDLARPKRTIRSLLMWEQYGLSYFFDRCRRRGRSFLTAMSMDGVYGRALPEYPVEFVHSSATVPWGGDFPWLRMVYEVFHEKLAGRYRYSDVRGHYGDDCILAQPAFGVPTLWVTSTSGPYHHNSALSWDKIDPELYRVSVSTTAAYLYAVACAGESEGRTWARDIFGIAREQVGTLMKGENVNREKAEFEADYYARCVESLARLEEAPKKAYKQHLADIGAAVRRLAPKYRPRASSSAVMRRARDWVVGLSDPACLPYDQAKIPFAKRRKLSGNVRGILNWCDGKRNLAEVARLAGLEREKKFDDGEVRVVMRDLNFLAGAGYVNIKKSTVVGKKDFIAALEKAGVKQGDTLFVHSSLSAFGKVEGGPAAVVEALRSVVGAEGLLSLPAYTSCDYRVGDGRPDYRGLVPFDPQTSPANTGAIADYFWRRKGVLRGTNPVHSTAAEGPGAAEFLAGDDEKTPCCSLAGPFGKMLLRNGKFVFLGTGMYCCTFLHAVEDACDLPCLTKGRALAAEGDVVRDIPMALFPGGAREFYKKPENECFRKLRKHGLKKKVVKVGLGEIEVMRARNLTVASLRMLAEDPLATSADSPFNPMAAFAEDARKKLGRIRKLLRLAEAGEWEKLIETGVRKNAE